MTLTLIDPTAAERDALEAENERLKQVEAAAVKLAACVAAHHDVYGGMMQQTLEALAAFRAALQGNKTDG